MKQFVIPQFIDVETKIIGFITVRQFLIMISTGFLILIAYKLCDFGLFILSSVLIITMGGILAFLKINGRPIHYFLINFFETLRKPKLKIWNNFLTDAELKSYMTKPKTEARAAAFVKKEFITSSRLSELSLMVDTGGAYKGDDDI